MRILIRRWLDRRTALRKRAEEREARLRKSAELVADQLISTANSSGLRYGWTIVDTRKGFGGSSTSMVFKLVSEALAEKLGNKFNKKDLVYSPEGSHAIHFGLDLSPKPAPKMAT